MDLEKELTCSICTELLYQPLTLLDCLHAFCGSCLKEWFSWQASQPQTSGSAPRFTCPSCRAAVRESRPNATVTSLLDMFLQANPGKAKPDEEKEEIAKKYKPGDAVLPAEPSGVGSRESDEEDRRLLEEVRAMSLREVGIGDQSAAPSSQDGQSFRDRQVRNAGSGERADDERDRRQRNDRGARRQTRHHGGHSSGGTDSMAARSRTARQIEHQASLRSLLSSSDRGEVTVAEEILRHIVEEGLLDGIDLDSLDQAQEEELSERIAEAYRKRHQHRVDSQRRNSENTIRPRESDHRRSRSQTANGQATATATEPSRQPPVSQPQMLQPASTDRGHQRRASDQGSRRRETSPALVNHASSSDVTLRPAARSSSDITNQRHRPQAGRPKTREPLSVTVPRRATESESNVPGAWSAITRAGNPRQDNGKQTAPTNADVTTTGVTQNSSQGSRPAPLSSSSLLSGDPLRTDRSAASRPSSSRSSAPRVSPRFYPEPSIACDRCGRSGIQYDLHKNCPECCNGNYNLCLRCYRLGQGCLRWSGFGPSGQSMLVQRSSPSGQSNSTSEPLHILRSRRYRRPAETASQSLNDGRELTSDNPANRVDDGMFCDICQSSCNECFFQCSLCNEGEWGFCHRCVNRGKCCTHRLVPIRRILKSEQESAAASAGGARTTSGVPVANESYDVLSFFTKCDICTSQIPPSETRYHCPTCNDGDYDICTNCYLKLVASGKISKENGHNGWRRCLNGHRMIVVGFKDSQRVVLRDLVGGHTFKDSYVQSQGQNQSSAGKGAAVLSPELGSGEWYWKDGSERRKKASRTRTNSTINGHEAGPPSSPTTISPGLPSARRFPPNGGVGLVVLAMWSYYPDDDVKDELLFPRGAEIRETENVNDEWYWGYYAGTTGLFPGTYGRVIDDVS
ncbi:hypothetical protein Egran_04371 [Elaphomyces granulatus]|uniref:RING-type domain-containing protein n=1 Tax=Elaphomyces granulatus TaxID=519963 RepID=A0A232LUN3_9EURO|nr:hypothetical protein Egran_04371 [Elaphomyces granulatus]